VNEAFLSPSEAAQRLGVSVKALRLYEQRGLLVPVRTASGWRAYGPDQMTRAHEIASLRALGFSLAQVARVLAGDPRGLEHALASHQGALEARLRDLAGTVEKLRCLREGLAKGRAPAAGDLTGLLAPASEIATAFDLPWPWGGERFEVRDVHALNYIIGPLGSGKTRLAMRIAETLPNAVFLGLDRLANGGASARAQLDADPALKARTDRTLAWLVEEGATHSDALVTLLASLESDGSSVLVIDLVEKGLDEATQEAVVAHLRRRGAGARPIFMLTRSSAILDLDSAGANETVILCPANHSPPVYVAPYAGAPGYEAVATCLAPPDVRARTEGMTAQMPEAA
jgi:DNA-binding transcriptional MerR regulator